MTVRSVSKNRAGQQEQAIALRCAGLTQEQVAVAVGVRRDTISRWERRPEYRLRLEETRRAIFEAAADRAGTLATTALDVLGEVLASDAAPQIKVQAAGRILDAAGRLREISTLSDRLAQLEAALTGGKLLLAYSGASTPTPWATAEVIESDDRINLPALVDTTDAD